MRKFYMINWMILLMGLISTTAFGQGVAYEGNFNNQEGASGSYKENLVIKLEGQNWFASSAYYGSEEFRLGHNKTSTIPSKFGLSSEGSSIEMQWDVENVKAFKIGAGRTYGTVDNWHIFESTDAGLSWKSVSTGKDLTAIQYTASTPKTARYALVITGSKNPRLVLTTVQILDQVVNQPPVITTESTTINGVFGGSLSFAVEAINDPTSWTATNLPTGITFDNGVFSGTYQAVGNFTTTVTATNDYGSDSKDFTFVVSEQPEASGCFEERFDDITAGNNTNTSGSSSAWGGNVNFPITNAAYQAGGAVKLGTGSKTGSIESKVLSDIAGDVKVTFDVKGWTNIEGEMIVTLGGQSQTVAYEAKIADNFETVTLDFSNVAANSTLKFETTAKRAFLDNILVCNSNPLVTETIWDGTSWSNGEPNSNVNAILEASYEEDLTAKTLTVVESAEVLVPAGVTYNVVGDVNVEGSLTFADGAYLIQQDDAAVNTGNIAFLKQVNNLFRIDVVLFSSPVAEQKVQEVAPLTHQNDFFVYNEANDDWDNIPAAQVANKTIGVAESVLVRAPRTALYYQGNESSPTTTDHTFKGAINNGTITKSVTKNGSGYNSVGNPYGSALNLDAFFADNDNVNSVHIWTHQYHVPAAGGKFAASNWVARNRTGSSVSSTPLLNADDLSVGQGFFVQVEGAGTIEFNNGQRSNAATTLLKAKANRYWLGLAKEDVKLNTMLIGYVDGATNGFDAGYDAKNVDNAPSFIYSIIENQYYVIDGRAADFSQDDVVKLVFKAEEATTYTIDLAAAEGIFADDQKVYLHDKLTQTVHDLATPYTFESLAGEFADRFEVIYTNRNLGVNDLTNAKDVVIYTNNNTVMVESKNAEIVSVEVFDVQGRKVLADYHVNTKTYQVATAAKGVLVVKVETANGKVETKKVIRK